jgi:hypothetical protein
MSLNGAYLILWQLKHMKLISFDRFLMVFGISKFPKLITIVYQDRLNLMYLHIIFLNISTKYVLCNNLNTPLTYSNLVNINPNMRELQQDIWRTGEDDQGGEWESIKILDENLTYILNSTRHASFLVQLRPHSYWEVIGPKKYDRNRNHSRRQHSMQVKSGAKV